MNITLQQIQQQHTLVKNNAHQILNQLKAAAPHSQLTNTMEGHVRQLEGLIAQGKSKETIDAHLNVMHRDLQNAQKQAYNQHNMPANHFGAGQMGQPGHIGSMQQQGQYGYAQGQTSHYNHSEATMTAAAQNPGHFNGTPSAHSIGNADYALRNLSKNLHNGYAKF